MIMQASIYQLLTNGIVKGALFPMATPSLCTAVFTLVLFLLGGRDWRRLPSGVFLFYSLSSIVYSLLTLQMRLSSCELSSVEFIIADAWRAHMHWFGFVL